MMVYGHWTGRGAWRLYIEFVLAFDERHEFEIYNILNLVHIFVLVSFDEY